VTENLARDLKQRNLPLEEFEPDLDIDIMFQPEGFQILHEPSQRKFTKIIKSLKKPQVRKSTAGNLDQIRFAVANLCPFTPTDKHIWKSIRKLTIPRTVRNFLWKCIHNAYRVGDFFERIPELQMLADCPVCKVTETLEHIFLECQAPGQKEIWLLTEQLWRRKFGYWPRLKWGTILGANLIKTRNPAESRLFGKLIPLSMEVIWKNRVRRRIQNQDDPALWPTTTSIHNEWVTQINKILRRDCILTNPNRFGPRALKRQDVLRTWSGLLADEDALPDDWINEGVLVGIQPIDTRTHRTGIG
jgi:hypothetical protein